MDHRSEVTWALALAHLNENPCFKTNILWTTRDHQGSEYGLDNQNFSKVDLKQTCSMLSLRMASETGSEQL